MLAQATGINELIIISSLQRPQLRGFRERYVPLRIIGTLKATVTDENNSGVKASSTFTITVAAPKLQIGISVPGYDSNQVPLNTGILIDSYSANTILTAYFN